MKKYRAFLAAAVLGALTLGLADSALAHGDGYGPPGYAWGHHKHHHHHERETVYYQPPVVVRPAPPVMMAPPQVYYPAPYAYYPQRRSPAVVIGVDIPPLVIPLR